MTSDFRADVLKGKVVLVTGGGSGIGLGIAKGLGTHGAKVAICGRRQEKLDEAVAGLAKLGVDAAGFTCDVREPEKCQRVVAQVVAKFGALDILVNNAAGNFSTPIDKLSMNGFKTILDIDLIGCFNMARAAQPELAKCGSGVIINISATLQYKAFPFQMAASSAKSAIDTMTTNMGVEWAVDYGIRTVAIAPGPIEGTVGGPGGRVFGAMLAASPSKDLRQFVPLGRFGTVDDIANTAIFVCSNAGSYLNACTLVVDGGHWHDASGNYLKAKKIIEQVSAKEKATHKGGVEKSKL